MSDEEYLLRLLDETRHEVDRSDAKASVLLAGVAAVAAIVAAGLLDPESSLRTSGSAPVVLASAAAIAMAATIVVFALAVMPRTGVGGEGTPRYFADFAAFSTSTDLRPALPVSPDDRCDRHAHQLHVLSRIVLTKYRWLVRGFQVGAGAVVLLAGTVVLILVRSGS